MNRRDFLIAGAAGFASALLPFGAASAARSADRRLLLLIELKGGNDGLNTIVPWRDRHYQLLRPNLALAAEQVIPLSESLGLNRAMASLEPVWRDEELGLVLGVGYPDPNRSHFRSVEIWETASDADEVLSEGWLKAALPRRPEALTDGVVLGSGGMGPLLGLGRALVMSDPSRFARQARGLAAAGGQRRNPALAHVLGVRQELVASRDALQRGGAKTVSSVDFPGGKFGRSLRHAVGLFSRPDGPTVIKVSHGSFDTHARQRATQDRLLKALADGLSAFRKAMREQGLWDQVLVMTYSEFGRRARENGSQGTDHGTAAPHLVMGGRVRGGFYGEQPGLDHLDNDDLRHTVDFRDLYATVETDWWSWPSKGRRLGFLRSA